MRQVAWELGPDAESSSYVPGWTHADAVKELIARETSKERSVVGHTNMNTVREARTHARHLQRTALWAGLTQGA